MYCGNCGQNNAPGALLCAQCGAGLTSADPGGTPAAQPGESYPPAGAPAYPPPGAPGVPGPEGGYPPGPEGYPPQQPGTPGPEAYPPQPPGYPSDPGYGQPQPGYGGSDYPPGYPPGPGYVGPPGGPTGGGKSQRGLLIGVLAVLVVAAIGAASFLVINSGDGGDDEQVLLEPVGMRQPDDFAGNRDLEEIGEGLAIALTDQPARTPAVEAELAGSTAPGHEPGLYGGSQNSEVCDIDGLVTFLTDSQNSDKAEAWADALGVEVGGISTYVEGLTAVRLRFDTRVTNHGFTDGQANPFQSVLQAGTAVLVDAQGIPRVKCNCGNPLAEPQPISGGSDNAGDVADLAQNPDDAWDGFDTADVVVVNEGDTVETFVMMDFEEGNIFRRPVGSNGDDDREFNERGDLCEAGGKLEGSPTCAEPELGTGDVQITLRWNSRADLDLHVFEPDGTEIYWNGSGPTATGGQLDVDANALCGDDPPIENVFWPEGGAPTGSYTVSVEGYSFTDDDTGEDCGSGSFTLTIRVAGQDALVYEGTVGQDETIEYQFDA